MRVPITCSPGRAGFGPSLSLSYDTGIGNGAFGIGWTLGLPSVTRKTERGLPRYRDDPDTFLLAGAEDLVPVRDAEGEIAFEDVGGYRVHRYVPRVEGLWARIERLTDLNNGAVHWRSISPTNITTLYGTGDDSRIFDPSRPDRVFSWLIAESYDDKGNWIAYDYAGENSAGVDGSQAHERNRTDESRSANRYLRSVRYGNRVSRLVEGDLDAASWHFSVVFDYDEGRVEDLGDGIALGSSDPVNDWPVRPDPFSRHRSCFEVRTYRRCRRVLMFHNFDELGTEPCLVRSTDFDYGEPTAAGSFLRSVTVAGYALSGAPDTMDGGVVRRTYDVKSMPPLEFGYTEAAIAPEVHLVQDDDLENLPQGLDIANGGFIDLDGDGMAGVLIEHDGAWYYKRNHGPDRTLPDDERRARFGPLEIVPRVPSAGQLTPLRRLVDVNGDGRPGLVDFEPALAGTVERSADGGWEPWTPFASLPNRRWDDPNLRFVDVTGRGLPDVVITEDDVIAWHPSLGLDGYGPLETVAHPGDEESGPRVLFADGTESIHLADVTGDGLSAIVRVRNGDVCYWPNLGYGRFGAKVTMDGAPAFDHPERFDQRRVRFADLDGSGLVDLVYLAGDGIRLYLNESGNRWSPRDSIGFPHVGGSIDVSLVDLVGDGTTCLAWSSSLPGDAAAPLRYLRLYVRKPHLLNRVVNNMGAETNLTYSPSTAFSADDREAGRPWITRLPFPVHVIERVDSADHITGNRFVTRYAYHHGHYDHVEREFRGFGRVEIWDSETHTGAPQDEPPTLTRTWFHTGDELTELQLVPEWHEQRKLLPFAHLPQDADAEERRQAARALKGSRLRQEIYCYDGTPQEPVPYTISESSYEVRLIEARYGPDPAIVHTLSTESIMLALERDPSDPRVAHDFNLEFDERGNPTRSAMVTYGRATADPSLPQPAVDEQQRTFVAVSETNFGDDLVQTGPPVYRLAVPIENRSHELTGAERADERFTAQELRDAVEDATEISYETEATDGEVELRLLSKTRTTFLDDSLAPLAFGTWDTLGLVDRTFTLAFTPSAVAAFYAGGVTDAELQAAGFVHFEGDADWWIPSGADVYPADAATRFYLPTSGIDAFGIETTATFDAYELLVEHTEVVQAPWQQTSAINDYRILAPVETTDANGNRSQIEVDALGLVVRSAVMGKTGTPDGDTLGDPTVKMDYTLDAWRVHGRPNSVRIRARERHGAANTRFRESWVYSNGSGGVALMKAQAAPGNALAVADDGTVSEVDADPRWIGTGRTVLNNKGSAIERYEPYFSVTHEYEDDAAVRELGVTPRFFYDPLGRNVRTVAPNGTLSRGEIGPWHQRALDANDTVGESTWYTDRGSPDPVVDAEPADPEQRAAWLAAKHVDTPATVHVNALGRTIAAVADLGGGKQLATHNRSDLTGRYSAVFDQLGRQVSSSTMTMTGFAVTSESAERGTSWALPDVSGAVLRSWDEHGRRFRTTYDLLRRRVSMFAQEPGGPERLIEHVVHGDRHPTAQDLNLLGAVHLLFDQAGMTRVPGLDFEGNPVTTEFTPADDPTAELDWSAVASQALYDDIEPAADPQLGDEVFAAGATHDALGRPLSVTFADGTVVDTTYDDGGAAATVAAQVRGQGAPIEVISESHHDAKGRRLDTLLGNDVRTEWFYDPLTGRPSRQLTGVDGTPAAQALQDRFYTYDPVGNVVSVRDDAQQTHFFANAVVRPESHFEFDAIYQLVRATGRELAGAANSAVRNHTHPAVATLPHPNDLHAVRTYTEDYDYDDLGNLTEHRHRFRTQAGVGAGWTRTYRYLRDDDPADRTNRLARTTAPGDNPAGPFTALYDHDVRGNMTSMPHLQRLDWDVSDRLREVDLGGGGTATYVYGTGGQRVRKIVDRAGDLRLEWLFLGPAMLFRRRRRSTGAVLLERWTIHVGDTGGSVVQIDVKISDPTDLEPEAGLDVPVLRYQHGDGLGSVALETDDTGQPISYEECHPFGTTAYWSSTSAFNLSLKRFRFSGKQCDDETGLYYVGARFYAPWLGRWTSCDPAGLVDGFNLFRYCRNSPTMHTDATGTQPQWTTTWRTLGTEQDPVTQSAIDTVEEFERWAVRHGVEYEGTPTLSGGTFWVERYRMVEPGAGGPRPDESGAPGQGTTATTGREAIQTHPEGHIHEVAENFDDGKIRAYNERIQSDRAVATRSREPGGTSRTNDIRGQNQGLRDNFEAALPGGQRPAGTQIDHTVELQDIGRHNNTVRPQDHRVQPSSLNASQGSRQAAVNRRRISQGIPEDVPAGAVARTSEMGNPRLQPGFRARVRSAGYGLLAAGPVLTAWGSSQVENAAVRRTGYALATAEGVGAGMYARGRFFMGGGAAGNASGLQMMTRGSGVLRVAGGAAGIVLGGYGLVTNYEAGEYGRMLGDASSIVGGGALLAGAAPVAAIAGGVGATNLAGDWVESKVTPEYGRTAGVGAGTVAGAATGAVIGAAIGVWFFGVGAPIGAGVGAVVGGVAGFIGAYW
jgi:RHS repeat-associated protein